MPNITREEKSRRRSDGVQRQRGTNKCTGHAGNHRCRKQRDLDSDQCQGHRLAVKWKYAAAQWNKATRNHERDDLLTVKQQVYLVDLVKQFPIEAEEMLKAVNACTGEETWYDWTTIAVGEARFIIGKLVELRDAAE